MYLFHFLYSIYEKIIHPAYTLVKSFPFIIAEAVTYRLCEALPVTLLECSKKSSLFR